MGPVLEYIETGPISLLTIMHRIHTNILGIIAGILTTISFVPQLVKILRTKQARDVSLYMYVVLTIGIMLWLIYGTLIKELPIILANSVAFILCFIIIVAKIRYSGR